uniref:UDP-N-acetylglucosamine transferase subunit ALG13 n=1 Tax=Pavo cristatus TaxID=9049 RepID=A0A8C9F4X7_PAVCR
TDRAGPKGAQRAELGSESPPSAGRHFGNRRDGPWRALWRPPARSRGAARLPAERAVAGHEVRLRHRGHHQLRRADCGRFLPGGRAGAGSCLETLEEGKPLLVVINEKLMDNHQLELARQLHKDGHVLYCNCSTLVETLQSMDLSTLKPFPPGQPEKFALFLDKVVGFE